MYGDMSLENTTKVCPYKHYTYHFLVYYHLSKKSPKITVVGELHFSSLSRSDLHILVACQESSDLKSLYSEHDLHCETTCTAVHVLSDQVTSITFHLGY